MVLGFGEANLENDGFQWDFSVLLWFLLENVGFSMLQFNSAHFLTFLSICHVDRVSFNCFTQFWVDEKTNTLSFSLTTSSFPPEDNQSHFYDATRRVSPRKVGKLSGTTNCGLFVVRPAAFCVRISGKGSSEAIRGNQGFTAFFLQIH